MSACASKLVWMRRIAIYEDNELYIDLAHFAVLTARTMHVDVKFHKTRERVRDGRHPLHRLRQQHGRLDDPAAQPRHV
jgi:hypothetical protein